MLRRDWSPLFRLGCFLAILPVLANIAACHDVLFRDAKRLPGDYELLKWEDGVTYYITTPGKHDESGCGPIDGTVFQLGWSVRYIVAKRHSCFRGDPDGWMIVDSQTHQVSGPHTDAELQTNESIKEIRTYNIAEAWNLLPCFTIHNFFARSCSAPWDPVNR